jgi:hypothetical protein
MLHKLRWVSYCQLSVVEVWHTVYISVYCIVHILRDTCVYRYPGTTKIPNVQTNHCFPGKAHTHTHTHRSLPTFLPTSLNAVLFLYFTCVVQNQLAIFPNESIC